ncbi:MAG: alpha/beta fold hydrolase [Terriglobales bacterium]
MKRVLICAVLLYAAAFAQAQNIAGDWQGTLSANGAELRLVLHIVQNADGTYKATLDSVDQGANGIPVTSIAIKNASLNLTIDAVHGTYEGKVSADASKIEGMWTQRQALPLTFKRAAAPIKTEHKPAKPSDIDGDWLGTIDTSMGKLRVVFHITNTEDGLIATLDSLDQGANGIPATSVSRNGSSLKVEVKSINGSFDGKIGGDLNVIDGTWTQMGNSFPLVLKRVKNSGELERRRPQNPAKPYPYKETEVSFDNKAAGVTLAATLTAPPGAGPFPAAVLITGSGPHDRDETLMGHEPFLVLADYLTRKGIVVLRADKRGCGKSKGDYAAATTIDFASDADAAVAYLKTRAEVNQHKIGLIGHSEGGIVAPMAAAGNPDVAFVVMMAGPGVRGDEILPAQLILISEAAGESHDKAEKDAADERTMLALIESEKDDAALNKELREKLAGKIPEGQIDAQIKTITSPWFRQFIAYDPAPTLRKLTCPVLAINGEKDLQVPPDQNLPVIRKALADAGNKNFEVDELPGLNHLFQTAKTGAVSEYGEIEETMAPVALDKIAIWIVKQTASNTNTVATQVR